MYQVFARKYRPQVFDDIIGQTHVTTTLKNAIKEKRIAHAYLFAGPRGVGKTTTARILAKALNCTDGPTPTPCGSCISCTEITGGRSLDVIEIDGASNRGIDEVRNLRENIKYAPTRGKYKIYIIDEVHMLTEPAFNALLKTLEEPPKHGIFIFATTAPYKVPLTILSRTQRFNFRKLTIKEIIENLNRVAEKEKIEIENNALYLIATRVDGALRDAQSMLDQLVSYTNGKIKKEDVENMIGLPESGLLFRILNAIAERNPKEIIILMDKSLGQGTNPGEIIDGLISKIRILFLIKMGLQTEIGEDEREDIHKLESKFNEEALLRMIRFLFDTRKIMKTSLSPEILSEEALVRLSTASPVTISEILEKISQFEHKELKEVPAGQQKTTAPEVQPNSEIEDTRLPDVGQVWQRAVEAIKKKSLSLGTSFAYGKLIRLQGDKLFLQYDNEFYKSRVQQELNIIEDEFQKLLHKNVRIVFEEPMEEKKDELLEEPIVLKAKELLDAEIISG